MAPHRPFQFWLLVGFTLLVSIPHILAANPEYRTDRIIVRFKSGVAASHKDALASLLGGTRLADLEIIEGAVLGVNGKSIESALTLAKRDPTVEYAEPDWIVHLVAIPNDPLFGQLYGMQNNGQTGGVAGADIRATLAWDFFTGDPNVKVGVIDTGVDYTHPDLAANIWTNPGEIPGNGVDDDANGYVDDVHGYDFANHDGDPMDDHFHGTHVSGTIAAVGNNGIGVAGVNWRCTIVGIKFLSQGGSGTVSGAIEAVQYARAVGVNLTSNSWGGGGFSQGLLDAINAAGEANQLFVAAAGNAGANTDVLASYPSGYDSPYIISVAATDDRDQLASFSNFGATTVDLGAPGVLVLSTVPGSAYAAYSGTSMATPHVAGVCALVAGRYPGITNSVLKDLVLTNADPIPALAGKCVTGGRLNAYSPISNSRDEIPPGPITDLATRNAGSTTIGLAWTATGDDDVSGISRRIEIRYSTQPIDANNFSSAILGPAIAPGPSGSEQQVEVTSLAYLTHYYFAVRAFDEFGNASLSNTANGTTLGPPALTISPLPETVSLHGGAQATRDLIVANTGEGTLDFMMPDPELVIPEPGGHAAASSSRDGTRQSGTPHIDGHGGPDKFEYRWLDSDDPNGPTYDWIDITRIGSSLDLYDTMISVSMPLGFEMPYYGSRYAEIWVYAHGFLSFSPASAGGSILPTPLPSLAGRRNLVGPYWGDFDPRIQAFGYNAKIYVYGDGDRFIVSWIGMRVWPWYNFPGSYSFQVILYRSGEIRFQYLQLDSPRDVATVGIQDRTATVGLSMGNIGTQYARPGLAVLIAPVKQWLKVAPLAGRVAAGEQMHLTVTYDATGYSLGNYLGIMNVETNAPDPEARLSTHLRVGFAPILATSAQSVDVRLPENSSETRILRITNSNATPEGEGLTFSILPTVETSRPASKAMARGAVDVRPWLSTWLEVTPSSGSIAAGSHQDIEIVLNSAGLAPGSFHGNLHVSSNDPQNQELDIPVTLQVGTTTDVEARPTSFRLSLADKNPMKSGTTRLVIAVPRPERVDVCVYEVRGAIVRQLLHDVTSPGFHTVVWDGKDDRGHRVASGVYFVRMRSASYDKTLRVVSIR